MAVKSKWFKAATAGATVDGREIKDEWLIDIAENYDLKEHEASIFLDHIRFYGNYGKVTDAELRKDDKGRNTLWFRIEPTPDLLALNAQHQYQYPSIGVVPNFAGIGKANLGHLGAVQDPASVGVAPINYANADGSQTEVICFACNDPVTFEIEPEQKPENSEIPSWFKNLFKKNTSQGTHMHKKILDEFKTELSSIKDDITALKEDFSGADTPHTSEDNTNYAQDIADLKTQVREFRTLLNKDNDKSNGKDKRFKDLETKFESLSSKLDDALKESDGTPSPPHTGDGNQEFSVF